MNDPERSRARSDSIPDPGDPERGGADHSTDRGQLLRSVLSRACFEPTYLALYGPRTTVAVALDDGVYEFSYGCTPEGCALPDGSFAPWICSRSRIEIAPDCRIFSPANMRAAQEVDGYKALLDHYMQDRYTLRYSGGLVPDIYQQFTKNQGVFSNPTSPKSPAKLRLAFEAAPFGLLVEKAGGKTSDGVTGGSILDVEINAVDQRTPLCIGSANEVDRFNDMVVNGK